MAQYSRADLEADLGQAKDLSKTRIVQLLANRPWKAVFGLYSFGASPADIEMLGRLALVAAHARTAFVAEGSVDMGDHWAQLKAIPESRSLALALPRVLLRLPYGAKASAIESFKFEEMPARPVHAHYLWGNPAFAVLAVAARGDEEDLDLDRLPVHTYQEDGEWKMAPCGEVWLTQTQAEGLMELGFIPLVSFRDQDRVRVAGMRSINGSPLRLMR
jgi:type VI secretion system protein ImpC